MLPDSQRWNHNIHYHHVVLDAVPVPCQRAVDVGCGEGQLTRALARRVDRVIGVDRDEYSIAAARTQSDAPNLEYITGDFLEVPAEARAFDLVTSVAALHHVDAEAALRRMAQLLRPGGVLVVVGLARTRWPADLWWEVAGTVAHRWHRLTKRVWTQPSPVAWPPSATHRDMRRLAASLLPGARYRRHLLWRYSLTWTRPGSLSADAAIADVGGQW